MSQEDGGAKDMVILPYKIASAVLQIPAAAGYDLR
jgi:hypothetical protein